MSEHEHKQPEGTDSPAVVGQPVAEEPSTAVAQPGPGVRCSNCDAPLMGPFCYSCGQSLKSPIRELTGLAVDLFEFITDIDGRFVKSLGLLYFRPGRLSMRYLEGQRVRFMRPLRMYLGLSIVLFLAVSLTNTVQTEVHVDGGNVQITGVDDEPVTPMTPEELVREAQEIEKLDPSSAEFARRISAHAARAAAQGEQAMREAQKQLPAELRDKPQVRFFGDQDWDKESNPLVISWLPDSANEALNELIQRGVDNIRKVEDDPQQLMDAFLDVLPQTMFVLLPLFALLLKLVYLFKKRLYVEHLIVALHSHSFLFLSFILLWAFAEVGSLLPALETLMTWVMIGVGSWIPVHLYLTQKRVYRQGWIMTTLKYVFVGNLYLIMLSFGALTALVISLVRL